MIDKSLSCLLTDSSMREAVVVRVKVQLLNLMKLNLMKLNLNKTSKVMRRKTKKPLHY